MKSFKDYTPRPETGKVEQAAERASGRTTEQPGAGSAGRETASAAELTKKIAAAYNGKSSAEMLRNILAEAERSKRAGTLSNAEIDAFYGQFAPMLGPVQRRQLRSVVERLKKL